MASGPEEEEEKAASERELDELVLLNAPEKSGAGAELVPNAPVPLGGIENPPIFCNAPTGNVVTFLKVVLLGIFRFTPLVNALAIFFYFKPDRRRG